MSDPSDDGMRSEIIKAFEREIDEPGLVIVD